MTEVPGGPGTPSAPARPALPLGPCRMERMKGTPPLCLRMLCLQVRPGGFSPDEVRHSPSRRRPRQSQGVRRSREGQQGPGGSGKGSFKPTSPVTYSSVKASSPTPPALAASTSSPANAVSTWGWVGSIRATERGGHERG
ncbi:hypothetical protein EYF80_044025 [Liparis tanakae]|uniref:Uncharacterized protein n=1 Tax=Liparis tanakae TaxID=230148 RepID=A0A4Z2FZI8_9TELE|nr:hypothetical protein EYF80_044025 [Liparis tanakae]